MTSFSTRSGRFILWIIVIAMVMLAIAVTALRVLLPKLNHYQAEISTQISEIVGVPFEIGGVQGYWRNTHPSISLKKLNIQHLVDTNITFDIKEVDIELDLIKSIVTLEPQIASLNMKGVKLDISRINLLNGHEQLEGGLEEEKSTKQKVLIVIEQMEKLFLNRLKEFSLREFEVSYQSYDGNRRTIDIEQLKWRNVDNKHKLEGLVSIVGHHINSLVVKASFENNDSIRDITGDFYVQANNIGVTSLLSPKWIEETGIESGQISFNSWFRIKNNQPVDAHVELLPSELIWKKEGDHSLRLENAVFKLSPISGENGWQINGKSLRIRNNKNEWPNMDFAFLLTPDKWMFNVSQLEIASLIPVFNLLPSRLDTKITAVKQWLTRLTPSGKIKDIRVSKSTKDESVLYSAFLKEGAIRQWELLPEVHEISADISGNGSSMSANVTLANDVLPYGDVFQTPLQIKNGEVNIVWETDEQGWRLWADRVAVVTPDLQVQGAFKLDSPKNSTPFLSFYAEADLYDAKETWRYLPVRALGQGLTNYLSTAIQGGEVDNAKLIWYGPLHSFPYKKNDGVFQAKVGLRNTTFSFNTSWPPITDMQLDLLFENESMYLSSYSATLMDVTAEKITGRIANLTSRGAVEIEAKASAKGLAVRNYMMATPLVHSVGAALTAVKVSGDVKSEFQLHIPFNTQRKPRVWGFADLLGNNVDIVAPPVALHNAKGRITFDNDIVGTSGLSANLLDQPISVDFKGENLGADYSIDIDILGDWDIESLTPYVGELWTDRIQGRTFWDMGIDIQLNDVGFTYQIESSADLESISSQYPIPFKKAVGQKSQLKMQASGNQDSISARLQLPDVKYQTEIDITGEKPILKATNLLIGKGSFKVHPIVGHDMTIRTSYFNLDKWLELYHEKSSVQQRFSLSEMNTPDIPSYQRVSISADTLTLAALDWHDVKFNARKKNSSWALKIDSSEVTGKANYLETNALTVELDKLHLFIPALDSEKNDDPVFYVDEEEPLVSDFDRKFHSLMPNLTLNIKDFWLQGYKVGQVDIELLKENRRLHWENIAINSGSNQIQAKGWWQLTENDSQSDISMFVKGENNTELMDRFGISSGIQKAPFELSSTLSWKGAPWSLKVNTLNGAISAEFGKGIVSDVSGAAKLLGVFSLDSIIRKMQLDFTDVFDKGMAFDRIKGTGRIERGIFITNDIKMDAIAGEMTINGVADLNTNTVDAEVEFTPDLTSGIPILTAFAVAPQTAIVVFAVSTVISPVIDVFTKIRYQIVGSLDSPEVKELSRSKGAYTLPSSEDKNMENKEAK